MKSIIGKNHGSTTSIFLQDNQFFKLEAVKTGEEFYIELETLGKKYPLCMHTVSDNKYWKSFMDILNDAIEMFTVEYYTSLTEVFNLNVFVENSANNYVYYKGFGVVEGLRSFLLEENIIL